MYASIAFPTFYFYSEYIKTSPVSIIVKKKFVWSLQNPDKGGSLTS